MLRLFLVHMVNPLFTLSLGPYSHGFSIRDIVMLAGGAYLIYKGIRELVDTLKLTEVKAETSEEHKALRTRYPTTGSRHHHGHGSGFSIDSVITAVGLAEHLIRS